MKPPLILPPEFYDRHATLVARDLLGMCLVRQQNGQRISGLIVETEAYVGEDDLACHARAGKTARTAVMYGPPGRAYVYFTYGMHWLLNCVTSPVDTPAAVLLRAVIPQEGLDLITARRVGRAPREWCNGPAKICQALEITGTMNGIDLCQPGGGLWIENGQPVPDVKVKTSPRVGLNSVLEPWLSMPWRFMADLT